MENKLLIICFIFYIVTQTIFIFPAYAAPQVTLLTHSGFKDLIGFYHVAGEVENTGDTTLNFIQVTATFYNSSHNVVATAFTFTTLSTLLPERKSPFEILLVDTGQAAKVDHYSLNVEYDVYLPTFPTGLEILSSSSYEDIIGYMHIVGEIKNIGTSTTTFVKVIATCYGTSNNVVATAFTFSNPSDLDPNETAPFEVLVLYADQVDLVTSYILTAESNDYAIIPEFPTIMIFPLIMMLTLVAILLKKREKRHIVATDFYFLFLK